MYKTGKKAKKEKAHTSTLRFVLLVYWLVGFFVFCWGKIIWFGWFGWSFGLAGLAGLADRLFQPAPNQVKTVKNAFVWYVTWVQSQELARFHRKRLEKCSNEKRQPDQPKPVGLKRFIPKKRDLRELKYTYCLSFLVRFPEYFGTWLEHAVLFSCC